MQYRTFGKLDWKPSALGFGAMRLPTVDGKIDEAEATAMIHYAFNHGVNYIDTAYPYHGGESEFVVGRALKGYRDRVRLATKMPTWLTKEPGDFDKYLDEQLKKLDVDYIDFYLLHALGRSRWEAVRDLGVLKWAEGALADGRIRHLGFSFHDDLAAFKEIVDAYHWDFCQIQHNYMDVKNQAGTEGLQYAAAKGLGVVIMEPILGGRLVNPPQPIQALWNDSPVKREAADWALQWLWNQPEVSVVLSGMSTMQQVVENVASAASSRVGSFSPQELAIIDQVRVRYQELCPIPCTKCRYCMPCPNGVDIPGNFAVMNEGIMYDKLDASRQHYTQWMPEPARADACIQCRECEEKCPQHILISEWMPVIKAVLGEGQSWDSCVHPQ